MMTPGPRDGGSRTIRTRERAGRPGGTGGTRRTGGTRGRKRAASRAVQVLVPLAVAGGAVAALGTVWTVPSWTGWVYAGMSLATFLTYAKDKAAARERRWRVPETTLHLLALLGGWPGALLGQQVLRHKTVKASFRGVFWLTVVANLVLLATVCSPAAASLLGPLLDPLRDALGGAGG